MEYCPVIMANFWKNNRPTRGNFSRILCKTDLRKIYEFFKEIIITSIGNGREIF